MRRSERRIPPPTSAGRSYSQWAWAHGGREQGADLPSCHCAQMPRRFSRRMPWRSRQLTWRLMDGVEIWYRGQYARGDVLGYPASRDSWCPAAGAPRLPEDRALMAVPWASRGRRRGRIFTTLLMVMRRAIAMAPSRSCRLTVPGSGCQRSWGEPWARPTFLLRRRGQVRGDVSPRLPCWSANWEVQTEIASGLFAEVSTVGNTRFLDAADGAPGSQDLWGIVWV